MSIVSVREAIERVSAASGRPVPLRAGEARRAA